MSAALPPPDDREQFVIHAHVALLIALGVGYAAGWIVCFLTGGAL